MVRRRRHTAKRAAYLKPIWLSGQTDLSPARVRLRPERGVDLDPQLIAQVLLATRGGEDVQLSAGLDLQQLLAFALR